MAENYQSKNSMMKYQIIFLKFRNFFQKTSFIINNKINKYQNHFFNNLKKNAMKQKSKSIKTILAVKKSKFFFESLEDKMKFIFFKR